MPFDFTNTETEHDVFTAESFIAWLETQNPETAYDWRNCKGYCLLSQYISARGKDPKRDYSRIQWTPIGSDGKWLGCIAQTQPWTFGAALIRARAALTDGGGR